MTTVIERNRLSPKSLRSTRGLGDRISTLMNSASRAAPATPKPMIIGDVQPRLGPSDSAYISAAKPSPERTNPGASRAPGLGWRSFGRNSEPKINAASPMGTLT
jgi:hypothetical protein